MKKKITIVLPIYYNEKNLNPLYDDLSEKVLSIMDSMNLDYEIIMVDDGSGDAGWKVMETLRERDHRIKLYRLSRNFGSHAAILCGLAHCTGDCAVIKAADMQEPSELILDMIKSWESGNNVVLAARKGRNEAKGQILFADLYYRMVRKTALPSMPEHGFDVYLIDRKVIEVLTRLDETNSALTGQILWSGFKTGVVAYERQAREIGQSRWTLKKKIRLVTDTLFSFSTFPIMVVSALGVISLLGSIIWAVVVLISRLLGQIQVSGWTTMFIFQLFSFGVIMSSLGILGGYIWRIFDSSRGRPPYIIEDSYENMDNHTEDKIDTRG